MRHGRSLSPNEGRSTMLRWLMLLGVVLASPLDPARLFAQSALGRVTGTVTAETGEPLTGAQIVVLTTRIGAATNADGRYTILAPPGRYQVRASMLGYQPVFDSVTVSEGQPTTVDFHL